MTLIVNLDERVQVCSSLLQTLQVRLDHLSNIQALPASTAELHTVSEALMALHGVLAGADAVLALENKRWGLE